MSDTKARLLRLLAIRPGDRILDAGCGAGHDLVSLAAAGARPVGADASVRMVAESRRRCAAAGVAAGLVVADAAALPLRAASMDACRMERLLQHVPAPPAVVAE